MGKINKFWKDHKGFTMVEAMVTTLIFSFIVAGIYGASAAGEASWQTNDVRIQLQQETRKALERMINELRGAGDASITGVLANGTQYSSITFKDPAGVSNGSIDWGGAPTIQYSLGGTGGKQLLRTSGGTSIVIGDHFESLGFRRQSTSPDILEVSLLAEKNTIKGRLISYQLDFNIQLRN